MPRSANASEYFTPESGDVADASTDMVEDFVLSLRERVPFERGLFWAVSATVDDNSHAGLPDLVGEDSEYRSEGGTKNKMEIEGLHMSMLSRIRKK